MTRQTLEGYRQVLRYWVATPARCGYASSGSRHRGAIGP
jgi:hypothetical protein